MALLRFKDYYPDYRNMFGNEEMVDFNSFQVYTESDRQIGSVKDALVDEQSGRFRYLVVDTGFWIFGKQVLLPIGLARFDHDAKRVYVDGLTKEQVENLPNFADDMVVDPDYENRVREGYRPLSNQRNLGQTATTNPATGTPATPIGTDRPTTNATNLPSPTVESSQPVDRVTTGVDRTDQLNQADLNRYDYDRDSSLYGLNERDHQRIRLYEEKLMTNKNRYKAGEVAVNKRIETETANVSVPVEKERVVIERNTPSVTPGAETTHDFREGEVARMEVYEESADIQKRPVVREEVNIRKEVDRDTVEANEQVRREELDVRKDGEPVVDDPLNTTRRRGEL